ncbi:MAG: matrixin family metalloprotease [Chloroflexi bacterium]|nr:matrixin family metalloprotease [Chloroflexota bacterium]
MTKQFLLLGTVMVLMAAVFGLITVAHAGTTLPEKSPTFQNQAQPTAEPTAQPSATPHPDVDIAQLDDPIPEGIPADSLQGAQDNNGPKFGDRIEPDPEPWGPDVPLPEGVSDPDAPTPDAVSDSATTLTPPPAPTGLRKVSDSYNSVRIGWSHVSGVAEYYIAYKKSGSGGWSYKHYRYPGSAYSVGSLSCATGYTFSVRAKGDGKTYAAQWSNWSSFLSATSGLCRVAAPSGLRATNVTGTGVSLRWNAVTGATRYRVQYREKNVDTYWRHGQYAGTGAYTTLGSLSCGKTYQFVVDAQGDGISYSRSFGPDSNVAEAKTVSCTPVTVLPPPTGLTVTARTCNSVSLDWNDVPDWSSYKIEYRTGTSGTWRHNTYVYTGSAYRVSRLAADATYQFRVRVRGDGKSHSLTYSGPSNTARGTTQCTTSTRPPTSTPHPTSTPRPTATPRPTSTPRPTRAVSAPANLVAKSPTKDSVTLNWRPPSGAALQRIEYGKTGTDSKTWNSKTIIYSGTAGVGIVSGLSCGTAYDFQVRAYGDGKTRAKGWGDASVPVSRQTDLCEPPKMNAATYKFFIPKDVTDGAFVGRVNATDPDPGDVITYAIGPGKFKIDSETGVIRVDGSLSQGAATVSVTARDRQGHVATAVVTINVVSPINFYRSLASWQVFDHIPYDDNPDDNIPPIVMLLDWIIPEGKRIDGHQYRLRVKNTPGWEIARMCNWNSSTPTETIWADPASISLWLSGCKQGTGRGELVLESRSGENLSISSTTTLATIPKAFHRPGKKVNYKLDTSLLKEQPPKDFSEAYKDKLNTAKEFEVGVRSGDNGWEFHQERKYGKEYFAFEEADSSQNVTIKGFWNADGGSDVKAPLCGRVPVCSAGAVACVCNVYRDDGTLGHSDMWFEFPPVGASGAPLKWTYISDLARNDPDNYIYLPMVAMHEFGHTAGLSHPRRGVNSLMAYGQMHTEPTDYDLEGIKHLYE